MASAFHKIIKTTEHSFKGLPSPMAEPKNEIYFAESETEDEEVKLTCIGGIRGTDDSDMNSPFSSEDEAEDDSDEDDQFTEQEEEARPLTFVTNHRFSKTVLVRPLAIFYSTRLSPQAEAGGGEEKPENLERRSVCARGIPLAVDTDCNTSAASCDLSDKLDSTMHSVEREEYDNGSSSKRDEEVEDEEAEYASSESSERDDDEVEEISMSSVSAYAKENDAEVCSLASSVAELSRSTEGFRDTTGSNSEDESSVMVIGVSQDRAPPATIPRLKRGISSSGLDILATPVSDCSTELSSGLSPKRHKSFAFEEPGLPLMPFSLGESAADFFPDGHTTSLLPYLGSNLLSYSDDDEEMGLDGQLRDELDCYQSECEGAGDNSPVPLLTPPASPIVMASSEETTCVCEWPSNLTVDNAMTAVMTEIRPLSPMMAGNDYLDFKNNHNTSALLPPLLRGMGVSGLSIFC